MAFSGYLLKAGGTEIPMKFIKYDGYTITPNQRMESEAKRSVTGVLHRTTVEHTASKIEFNTPNLTNAEMEQLMSIFRGAWGESGTLERKLTLQYYDMETNDYKTGEFYMPDIKFQIMQIQGNVIVYKETRIAFIEY